MSDACERIINAMPATSVGEERAMSDACERIINAMPAMSVGEERA